MPDKRLQINDAKKNISTSTQLREILYAGFQDMLVLSSTVASRYYNCCTDGSTISRNYGWQWYLSFDNDSGLATAQAVGRSSALYSAGLGSIQIQTMGICDGHSETVASFSQRGSFSYETIPPNCFISHNRSLDTDCVTKEPI
jgi:hypothetical protein